LTPIRERNRQLEEGTGNGTERGLESLSGSVSEGDRPREREGVRERAREGGRERG